MRNSILIITLLISFQSFAQDMPDTRKKNESFSKLPNSDIKSDLATFNFAGIDQAVGQEPIKKISFTSFGSDYMLFQSGDIKAVVRIAPFDQSKHKLEFDEKYLVKIDKKTYYGSYPNTPKSYIQEITLIVGKDTIAIPPTAYNDLYNLSLTYTDKSGIARSANGVFLSKDGHKMYLYLFSKDKDSDYEVTYIIQDKKYVRRVLDYDFNL